MSAAAKPRAILLPHAPALVAALLLLSFVAFWVPYFSQLSVASRYVHFHVATMLVWMCLLIVQPLLLAGFYAAALLRRREPAVHARWMLATALPLIDPVIARVLAFHLPQWADASDWLGPLIAMATLAIIIVAERRSSRGRHVFPIVLALVLAQLILFYTLGTSAAWRTFAQWFAALPLS